VGDCELFYFILFLTCRFFLKCLGPWRNWRAWSSEIYGDKAGMEYGMFCCWIWFDWRGSV